MILTQIVLLADIMQVVADQIAHLMIFVFMITVCLPMKSKNFRKV